MSFFRKLMTRTHDYKRYALYVVGELILIVLGIYIALQLDDWKNIQDRHAAELEVLDEIATGFERDIGDLKFNIYLHSNAARSGEIVLKHLEGGLPYSDSLSKHFATVLWYSRITVVKGAFDYFKGKGLDIITNDSLRIRITAMYDLQYNALQLFERNTFLPDDYILEVHAKRFDKTEIYVPLGGRNFGAGSMIPYDYEALKRDRDYLHVVRTCVSKNRFFVEFFIKSALEELTSLQREVVKERERLLAKY